jgi:hypothetical protein
MKLRYENSLHFNTYGQFLYGLAKYAPTDSFIIGYVDAKLLVGNISPSMLSDGLMKLNPDLQESFLKRIIVVEFYYQIMKWDIERTGNKVSSSTFD